MADDAPDAPGEDREPPSYDPEEGASEASLSLPDARAFAEKVVGTVRGGLLVLDRELRVVAASEPFYRAFGVGPEETLGLHLYRLGAGAWALPELVARLEGVLARDEAFEDYEIDGEFERVGRRVALLNGRRLGDHLVLLAVEDVTGRRAGEHGLRESDRDFRALVDRSPEAILIHARGRVAYANAAAARLLGAAAPDELVGRDPLAVIDPEAHDLVRARIRRAVEEGAPNPLAEYRWRRLDGTLVDAEVHSGPIEWDGAPAVQVVVRDVTGQKDAERVLRQSEGRFRLIVDAVPQLVWATRLDGYHEYFNERWYAYTGMPRPGEPGGEPEVAQGWNWKEYLHPDDYDRAVARWTRALETGEPYEIEYRFRRAADGAFRWFIGRAEPVRDGAGAVVQWFGTCTDIQDLRDAEAALADAARRNAEVLESITDGFFALDRDWRFTYVNALAARLLDRELDDLPGRVLWDAFPEALDSPFEANYRRAVETGHAQAFDAHFPPLDAHFAVRAFPFAGGLSVYFRDVTEERRTEAGLRESEERFRAVADLVPDLLWRAGPGGERTWGNRRWTEYTGQTPDEAAGFGWAEAVHPDDRNRALREATGADGPFRAEHRVRRADGAYRWFLVNAAPVRDGDGRVMEWFGASTDVHDQRTAMETLEARVEGRTREVRALGRALALAEQAERRRIAHLLHDDLQQRLYGLSITLGLLRRSRSGEEAEGLLDRAEGALGEATALTRTLSLELSPPLLKGDDLADLLQWVADRKREAYGLDVTVEVREAVSVPEEEVRVLLHQLLRELLFNVAKHAGTDRARIVAERAEGGSAVRITVEDEGAGFDPATLDARAGGGLGLPSVRERIEFVGGRLDVESAPGEGTRVTVEVPSGPGLE